MNGTKSQRLQLGVSWCHSGVSAHFMMVDTIVTDLSKDLMMGQVVSLVSLDFQVRARILIVSRSISFHLYKSVHFARDARSAGLAAVGGYTRDTQRCFTNALL